jgi:hypothetical protein
MKIIKFSYKTYEFSQFGFLPIFPIELRNDLVSAYANANPNIPHSTGICLFPSINPISNIKK